MRCFSDLDSREIYIIYRHILGNIRKQTMAAVSLNMSIIFLETNYVDMLLSEFGGDTLILELAESSSLEPIIEVQDRLDEIRKGSRVRIWLDDFGTERSNFDLMNVMNFDAVEMSKELFWDLHENDKILLKHMVK